MKQLYIVANWKEKMLQEQARLWVKQIADSEWPMESEKTVVLCPPFTLLSEVKQLVNEKRLSFTLGAQNISQFPEGAHTGEESGDMLKELVNYVIIGHSERRAMGETNEMVNQKIVQALKNNLTPIICVSNKEQTHSIQVPDQTQKLLIAYEPLEAIGTGKPENPIDANDVAGKIKKNVGESITVLYGGSVNPENVHMFTSQEMIEGVLVGGASLDATQFAAIIQKA